MYKKLNMCIIIMKLWVLIIFCHFESIKALGYTTNANIQQGHVINVIVYSRRGTRATRWGVTVLLHAPFHTAFYSTSSSSLFDFWILMTSSSILKCGHTAYISFSNIGHCKSWIFTGIKPASHWRGKLGTNWEDWKEVKTWSRICGL